MLLYSEMVVSAYFSSLRNLRMTANSILLIPLLDCVGVCIWIGVEGDELNSAASDYAELQITATANFRNMKRNPTWEKYFSFPFGHCLMCAMHTVCSRDNTTSVRLDLMENGWQCVRLTTCHWCGEEMLLSNPNGNIEGYYTSILRYAICRSGFGECWKWDTASQNISIGCIGLLGSEVVIAKSIQRNSEISRKLTGKTRENSSQEKLWRIGSNFIFLMKLKKIKSKSN